MCQSHTSNMDHWQLTQRLWNEALTVRLWIQSSVFSFCCFCLYPFACVTRYEQVWFQTFHLLKIWSYGIWGPSVHRHHLAPCRGPGLGQRDFLHDDCQHGAQLLWPGERPPLDLLQPDPREDYWLPGQSKAPRPQEYNGATGRYEIVVVLVTLYKLSWL